MQPVLARPVDRGRQQRRPHALPSPIARDGHPEFAEPVPACVHVHGAEDLVSFDRDERALERPARGPSLDVDRRLGGDAVALLGDRGEDDREGHAVLLASRADLEGGGGHP